MIRCRTCDRRHEDGVADCVCGADLSLDGVPEAGGADDIFGGVDLGGSLADLDDLPGLDLPDLGAGAGGSAPLAGPDELPQPSESALFGAVPADPDAAIAADPLAVAPPPADPEPTTPRRDFAVQPRMDSGEEDRGSPTTRRSAEPTSDPTQPVPSAPVVDDDLEHSVFAETDGSWAGAGALRTELDHDRAGGTITCPTCSREVPRDRHFCKCGREFDIPVRLPTPQASEPGRLVLLWRRLTGSAKTAQGDQRNWGQRARDAGAQRGMTYATRRSARSQLGRIGLAFVGGAGLLMALGPLRGQVRELPDFFVPTTLQELDYAVADACDTQADTPADTPWFTAWGDAGASGLTLDCDGVITGTFASPVDIDRLRLESGPSSGQANENLGQPVRTPRVVTVTFTRDNGETKAQEFTDLVDNSVEQDHRVTVRDVVAFELRIDDVQPVTWPALDVVQIGRVAFVEE